MNFMELIEILKSQTIILYIKFITENRAFCKRQGSKITIQYLSSNQSAAETVNVIISADAVVQ